MRIGLGLDRLTSRTPETEASYNAMKLAYRSVEDSVRITVFGWRRERDAITGKLMAVRPLSGWRQRALVPNAFPYAIREEHWVLWSERPMRRAEVEEYLAREMPVGRSLVRWWRNPVSRQSVRGIWHVQVILGRK